MADSVQGAIADSSCLGYAAKRLLDRVVGQRLGRRLDGAEDEIDPWHAFNAGECRQSRGRNRPAGEARFRVRQVELHLVSTDVLPPQSQQFRYSGTGEDSGT